MIAIPVSGQVVLRGSRARHALIVAVFGLAFLCLATPLRAGVSGNVAGVVSLQSLISACRESGGRKGAQELRETCEALRAEEGRRATLGGWFYRFEQLLQRKLDEAERLLGHEAAGRA